MKPGDLVKHKLTGETLLVLSQAGYGASTIQRERLRRKDLSEIWIDAAELEEEQFCKRCGKSKWSFTFDGCTGPCVFK